ncbi:gliding motility-associated-like protein [Flavobacterium sp. 1]|uniref:Ig-like domain-containing protein n=1 Tax=Flavobacterium sp. 1 TaxID=2035200 RepID=UPI000CB67CDB|nr:gliding motility-associated C-terminal domain-containing protein [Flavobacterium sp. 1]PJJ09115.1 gliding motility-associated-like protein [Flavobacterium sp. 1]
MRKRYFPTKYLLFLTLFIIQTSGLAQSASRATTGTGLYKEKIFWINWDLNSDSLQKDLITNGIVRTFTSPSGIVYRATISNIVQTITPGTFSSAYIDSFGGNNMPFGYGGFSSNGTKMIGLSNKIIGGAGSGNKVNFRITVTATLPSGAIINAAGLAIAGAESMSGPTEYYQLSVPIASPVLRYLDKFIKNDTWTNMITRLIVSNSGRTIKATNPGSGDSKGDALLFAEDVPYIDVELAASGGGQSVAIGIFEELDFSDAPVSYGSAYHIVNSAFTGGNFAAGNKDLSTTTNVLDTDRATLVDPLLLIGTDVDTEGAGYNAAIGTAPNGDDLGGSDDEDASMNFTWSTCSATINVKNTTTVAAKLYVWIDANRNGVFDTNELATSTVPIGTNGNVVVPLSSIKGLNNGTNFYARIRLSTDLSLTSTGLAIDGEVEDHWVDVTQSVISLVTTPVCQGSTVSLSGVNGASTYAWTGPNGFTSSLQSPIIPNAQVVNAGIYSLKITTGSGCEFTESVTVAVTATPTVPTATAQTFCLADGKKVSDLTVSAGTAIKWYSAVTSGTLYTGTETLATGTYFASQTVNGCESARTSVAVTVNAATPTASAQTFCSAEAKKVSDLSASGTGIKWYSALTAGTLYAGTETLATGTYYASQTVNGCESSRASVAVTVNTTPSAPTALAQTFCSSEAKKVSDLSASGTAVKWYSAVTAGTLYAGTETLATGTYYASQTVNGCESARTSVAVTVNTTPVVPTASAQTYCSSEAKKVSDLSATGTAVKWYSAVTAGTLYAGTETLATGTYYASQTVNGCESSRASAAVTITASPSAPTASAQTYCSSEAKKVSDLSATGTAVKWYSALTAGTLYAGTEALATGTYYASQTVNGCESSRASVSVTITASPSAPTASAQTFCSAEAKKVSDLAVSGTAVKWYSAATAGTLYAGTETLATGTYYASQTVNGCESARTSAAVTITASPSAPTASAQTYCSSEAKKVSDLSASGTAVKWYSALTAGILYTGTEALATGTYYASQTVNGCESGRASAAVTITASPSAPTASAQTYCSSEAKKVSDLSATGTAVKWYSALTAGTLYAGTETLATGTYYASQTVNGCESGRASVAVTITASPSAPTALAQTFCSSEAKKVSDLGATGTGIKWYSALTAGTLYAGTEALATGTYYASQTVNGCESSRASVSVTITASPSAPTASAQTFCSAEAKKVSDLAVSGTAVKWYSALTAGTLYAGTEALATGTYYASQTVNGCESGRASAAVTITASPSAPTASAQTYCSSEAKKVSDLSATGTGIKWYSALTAGTLYAGTEALATGTYYASQTVNGCESSRASVSVTITASPSAPTASAQTFCSSEAKKVSDLAVSGTAVKWYSALTAGTLYAGTEALATGTYYASQTVNGCESARASAAVTITASPSAPTASAQTYCSSEAKKVSDLSASGTAVKWYSALTAGTLYAGTETLATGTYYASQTVNGCESSRASVAVTVNTTPSAPTASAQTYCSSEAKKVSDLGATGTGIKWYSALTAGILYTGTEALATGTYYASQTVNGCESSRASVSVTITASPSAPTASAQTYCSSEAKKVSDLSATGTGIKWYSALTAGILYTGTEALATGTYYASQTVNGCESSRASAAVTITASPSAPTASAQTYCSSEAKKVSDLSASGTAVKWYSALTAGTLYAGTETLATGTYYASQTVNGCESARTSVAVTVNTTPVVPTASAQTYCSSEAKKVSDLSATGTAVKWYSAVTAGTLYAGTETLATGTYYASQTVNGCESGRASAAVTITASPSAPTALAQTFCSSEAKKVSDLSATGTAVKWYSASTAGTLYAGTEALATGTYFASQTVNGCESGRTSVAVTVNTTPVVPTASAQTYCSSEAKKVSDLSATGTAVKWYSAVTAGTLYAGTETLATGIYYASQTVNGCESARTSVSVTITASPSAPTASAQVFCSSEAKKVSDLSATGTAVKWYSAVTAGTLYAGTEALATGTYYASQTVNGCESARTSVAVTVNTTPVVPTATAQTYCSSEAKKVSDLSATGTAVKWYSAFTAGTLYAGTEALATGTYFASQTVNGCESARTSVSVTITASPAVPTASTQTFCSAETKKVSDLSASGTGIKWYSASTAGTLYAGIETLATGTYYASQTVNGCESSRASAAVTITASPSAPTASAQTFCSAEAKKVSDLAVSGTAVKWYSALTAGTLYAGTEALATGTYYASQTVNGCESARASAAVTITASPSAPTASAQIYCSSEAKKVSDLSASGTAVKWYSALTAGTLYTGTETLATGTYYASQTVNGCESSRASVAVTVNTTPSAPTASAQTYCSSEAKKVSDLSATGTAVKWYSAATAGTLYTGTETLATGTYYASQTVNGCESARASAAVTITASPSAPTASAQTYCSSEAKKVSDLGATGTGIKWYSALTAGTLYAGTEALATGTYYASQTVNGCESSRASAAVTITASPSAPTASAQTFCSAEAKKVSDLAVSGTAVKWYSALTAGTLYAGTEALATGTYYASQTVNGCESARTSVAVTITASPSAPTASAQTYCSSEAKKVSDLSATGTGIKWYSALTAGTLYAGTETLATGTYYASQTVNGCESSRASVAVTVNTTPSAPTASAQTYCSSEAKKVSDLGATGTGIKWYSALTAGILYTGTEALATGTYYASQTVNGCESSRASVSVTITASPSAPTASAQTYCSSEAKKVSDLSATGTGIKWYSALTAGILYTGTEALATGTYYASQTVNGCESSRASAAVTITASPSAPTASAQTYCSSEAKKVSDLSASGTAVKWYSALTAGTLYAGTETLATGTYYASQTVNGCESARTSVAVTVNTTPVVPTASAQTYCSSEAKKVSDLSATGTAVKWYSAVTAGTLYAGTETLATGTYYASQTVNGCESGRASAAVTITASPSAPTALAQTFCSSEAKKVSDLSATGTAVKWYSASTAGTLYAGTEALATGTYFASQTVNGCESGRTSVAVTVNTTPVVPTASAQTYCSSEAKKVSDLSATGTAVKWYSAVTAGTLYAGTETLATGIYYASQTVNGCESARTSVSVTITASPSAPTASAQVFCSSEAKKVSDLSATGTAVKWYSAVTAGTLYAGTEALATGTYYASQTVNGCESARTSVAVTVNTTPVVPTATAQTYCSSEAKKVSDLSATGTAVKWYSAVTAGTLYAGTEALATGTYYASQTVNGCESARTSVAVTVNTTPVVPTATAQTYCSSEAKKVSDLSATGTAVKWYSAFTAGTLYAGTEALATGTYFASQTVNGCESARTSVSVTITASPSAPTASAQTYCSSEAKKVSDLSASGTAVKWYSAVTAGTLYAGTETLATGTYFASQTVNGCESARTSVSVTITASPSAPTASAQTYCSSEAKKVSDLSASGTAVKWYSAVTAGTLYAGTETLATGTYFASQTANGCESSRASVSVTITASPSAPTASAQTYCSSEAKKVSDLSASGTAVKWYSAVTAGTLYAGTETLATGTYFASQTVNGCESARTSVAVTVNTTPVVPTASAQTYCSSEAKKVSDLSASGTAVKWYSAVTAGTLYAGTETLATGTYYASQTVNGCESARTSVAVTVNTTPVVPTASAQTYCSSEAKKVSDLSASGTGIKWYSAVTAGTLYAGTETLATGTYFASQTANGCESSRASVSVTITASPSAPTASAQTYCSSEAKKVSDLSASGTAVKWYSAVTAGTLYAGTETLATGTYYASQTANGCESARTSVSVTITPSPTAPSPTAPTFCSSEAKKVSDLSALGTGIKWYSALTAGTLYAGTETLATGTYYASQTVNGCESSRASVSVTITPSPTSPTASAQTFCSSEGKKVSDLAASGTGIKWYSAVTAGTLYAGTETLATGTYYASQTVNGCESARTSVSVTITASPSAPTASAQTFCSSEGKKVSDLSAAGTAVKWYSAATAGTLYAGTETLATGTYYASQTVNGCESARTSVSVTITASPSVPTASAQTYCSSEAKKVSDLSASGTAVKWYSAVTAGTLYAGTETLATGTYYASQTVNGCESARTSVSVTITASPSAPTASAQTYCSSEAKKVSDLSASGTAVKWYSAVTAGTLYAGTETLATGTYFASQTVNGCESARTSVSVTITASPSAPTASAQTYCSSEAKKVSDLSASGTAVKWYSAVTAGTLYAGTETLATGTYFASQTANGCESSRASVSVTITASPSAPTASAQTYCSSEAKKVSDLSASGTAVKWYSAVTAGTLYAGTETLATGTYFASQTVNGCESARTSVAVTVNTTPVVPTASAQTYCSSEAKKVSDLSASGTAVKWYSAVTAGTLYAGTETLATGTYYASQTVNGCESARTSVAVTVNTTPVVPTASAQTYCSSEAKKVNDLAASGAGIKWYSAVTAGTLYAGTETLATGTYYASQTANGCESARTSVSVTITASPSVPTASAQTYCSSEAKKVSDLSASGTAVKWYSAVTAGTLYAGTETLATGTYYASQTVNGCESARTSVSVTITASPSAPTASAQTYCSSEAKKVSDLSASGTAVKWYSAVTAGTLYAGTETLATGTYFASQTVNGCESARTSVSVTITASPSAPTASAQTYCSSEAKKVSDLSASGTAVKWYSAVTAGTLYAGTETLATGTYFASQTVNGCESARTSVSVTITASPSAPTASAQTYCSSEAKKVSDLSASGTAVKWYSAVTAGTLYAGTETLATGTYFASQTANGCESSRASVSVTITASPSAPTASAQTYCSSEAKKVSDLSASGTAVKWYSAVTAGTLYAGTETLATGTYFASQTVNGCESARTSVAVTVNTTPVVPTASAQTYCSSEAKKVSDLSASGTAVKWYSAVTAGTLYAGTETLATGTYYASQTVNGCESARTSVAVTVNTTPVVPTASAQTYCSSEAKKVSDLSASGTGIKWYSAVTAGTLYAGTETLATGTYFASQTANGCESSRASVSVTITASPSAPTASAQTYCSSEAKKVSDLSASGTAVKWYSAVTAGTLYAGTETLATGTYYASQTANGCESARTSVSVTITPSPTAPSPTAPTFCSSEAKKVSDLSALGTGIKWYSALTAGTLYAGTETLATGTYYASQTVNGCESSRASVSVTITPSPTSPTASAQTFCSSEGKKVSDLAASGTGIKWYSAVTAGTLYAGTETLATGTYYASQTVNGCESARTSVSVTITASPSAPTASAQTFCSSEGKKVSDLSAAGTAVKWYSAATAGTLYAGTETLATGTYYASQTVNGCESARTSVSVTITASPSAPTASAQTYCSSEAKKVSDLSASGTAVKWYSAATAGTLYAGTETLATGTYYASQTVNGCESARTSVSVTITASPSAPTASAQTYCSSEAKKVSDLSASGTAVKWYSAVTAGTLYAGTETLATGTYYASQTANGCESARASVSVTITASPSAPTASAQTFCSSEGKKVSDLSATGTAVKWYSAITAGTLYAGTETLATGIYYASQTVNGCESARASVSVTITASPSAPTASAQTYCSSEAKKVSDLGATGTGIKWYSALTAGTLYAGTEALATGTYYASQTVNGCESSRASAAVTITASPSAPTASAQTFCSAEAKKVSDLAVSGTAVKWYSALTAGTLYAGTEALATGTYYASQTVNGCESARTSVAVTITASPSAPTASAQTYCSSEAKKVSDLSATGTGIKWYSALTAGILYTGTEALATGTYYASQTVNGCESSRASAAVTITASPSAPTASAQTFCSAEAKKVSDLAVSGTAVKWYSALTAGTLYAGTEALATGTYYASQTVNGCESARTSAAVTITASPSAPTASAQTYCSSEAKKVSDLSATGTGIKWYSALTAGILYTGTEALATGTYYASQTVNGCESGRASAAVTITASPSAPTASAQTYCSSEAKKVSDLSATGTGIKWYSALTAGTLYAGTEALATGTYYASQTVNGCESARASAAVTITASPSAPTASAQTYCSSEAKKVSDLAVSGTAVKWYSALTAGTLYAGTEALATGTYYASQTVNGCESARASAAVTITASPSAPTASAQTYCSSEAKKVSDLSATGTAVKWYSALTAGTLYAGTETLATGTYYASQTVNGCESSRTSVAVTVNTTPVVPTASAQTYCSSEAKKVSDLSATGTAVKWYSAATAGTLYAGTETLATGTYYASQTVNGCESGRASVAVTITASPSAPTALAQTFCSSEAKKVSDLSASGTAVKWYSAVTAGTLYAGTETLATGTYYASQTVNGCESARTSVAVTVNTTPVVPTASAQTYCSSEAKKVSDLSATGTAVKWYSAVTAGTLYAGTETLATGTYYASQTVNGCESGRASAAVTITASPSAPTALAQTFCSSEAKKVSDLSATGTAVKWYSALTAGTLYAGTEALATGTYYASQTVNGCESTRTSVSVTITASPSAPTATAQTYCSSEAKKVSDLSASGTGIKWYSALTAGTLYTGTEALATGTYYASQTVNGCESARTSVSVTITASPSAPTATAQTYCSSEAKKVSDLSASGTGIKWYSASTAGTLYAGTEALATGTYFASQTVNGCESGRTSVAVTVNTTPVVPTASAQTYCSSEAKKVSDLSATGTAVKWYSAVTAGTLYAGTEALATGTYFASQTVNGCESARTSVSVTITASPAVPTASTQTFCSAETKKVSDLSASGTGIKWYSASTAGTLYAGIETLATGTYYASQTVNGCESSRASVSVTITPPPVGGLVSSNQVITSGTFPADLLLSGNFGSVVKWQKSNDAGFMNPVAISITSTTLLGSTIGNLTVNTYFRAVVQNGVCNPVFSNSVLIAIETAPDVTVDDATIAEGGILSFPVKLSNPSVTNITVTLNFVNGTAGNSDYTATPVTVTFLAGSTKATATVQTTDDLIDELNEDLTVKIASTTGTVGNISDTAIGIIQDNDDAPSITAKDDIISGGNGTAGTLNAGNVLASSPTNLDILNGKPVVIGLVDLKVVTPAVSKTPGASVPLIDIATGTVSVPANTPEGIYTLTYSICEKANPSSNCSIAKVTVFVARPSIGLVKTAHFNDENGDGYANAGETITYNFTVTNTGNEPLTNVTVTDTSLPGLVMKGSSIAVLGTGMTNSTAYVASYAITQADINFGSVSNQAIVSGISPTGILVKDLSDDGNNLSDKPTIVIIPGCSIEVFNALSPNGDGHNDIFYIRGLECYPDNTVEVYNRWGVLVFERENYNNDDRAFRGVSEGRVTVNKFDELPVGTYYYIFRYKDSASNMHEKAGYLYINRK